MKKRLLRKRIKTGGVYLGFDTLKGRKFPYGNFRTSVFCKVKTQIVGKTKFFDSLRADFYQSALFFPFYQVLWSETWNFLRLPIFCARMSISLQTSSIVTPHSFIMTIM